MKKKRGASATAKRVVKNRKLDLGDFDTDQVFEHALNPRPVKPEFVDPVGSTYTWPHIEVSPYVPENSIIVNTNYGQLLRGSLMPSVGLLGGLGV